ncbi:MAG TPA: hypothetical protein DDW52_16695 [Planctomycetaceae bacterium]|nr:hypothetical protein [Planctomycetaceae bacterium]
MTDFSAVLSQPVQEDATFRKLRDGGQVERVAFFEANRENLKKMARFRIDRRLVKRMDDSDMLQEAYIEYCKRLQRYLDNPRLPPTIWLRRLVRQVISQKNRNNVEAQCRDLRREVLQGVSSGINIDQLSDSLTSIGGRLQRVELREKLHKIVTSMSPIEREILVLVHFEGQTIREAALELDITLEAAKKRHRRALNRLREAHEDELLELQQGLDS